MADDIRWYLLFLRRQELKIAEAFAILRGAGIEPILIKGWAAARFYPAGSPRYFSDIDLAVSAADHGRAGNLLKAPTAEINVDLHNELRHLDRQPWDELFERSELVDAGGTRFRVLCAEDHLRLMCVHWLTDGGEYKDRLWDIYHTIDSTRGHFDWKLCLDAAGPTRRKWIMTVIALAHRHLGLEISDLPFADEEQSVPAWLIRTLEREWASDIRLRPLHGCFHDPKMLLRQVRKRLPPNPIMATVDLEGEFDEGSRVPYQVRDVFYRLAPSLRRVVPAILRR